MTRNGSRLLANYIRCSLSLSQRSLNPCYYPAIARTTPTNPRNRLLHPFMLQLVRSIEPRHIPPGWSPVSFFASPDAPKRLVLLHSLGIVVAAGLLVWWTDGAIHWWSSRGAPCAGCFPIAGFLVRSKARRSSTSSLFPLLLQA